MLLRLVSSLEMWIFSGDKAATTKHRGDGQKARLGREQSSNSQQLSGRVGQVKGDFLMTLGFLSP